MFEILEKIVKHLAKLDNYCVLRQEKEHIILGTKIIIKKTKLVQPHLSFTTVTMEVDIELPIFFVVTTQSLSKLEIDQFFITNKLPILPLHGKKCTITLDSTRNLLNDFVKDNFNY